MNKLKDYIIDWKLPSEKISEIYKNSMKAFEIFCEEYNTHYGSIEIDDNLIEIHTGGWSDNEELLYQLKKTAFWNTVYVIDSDGGHYYLDSDRYNKDKKHHSIIVK